MIYLFIQIGTIIPCFVGEQMLRYLLVISGPGRVVDCGDMYGLYEIRSVFSIYIKWLDALIIPEKSRTLNSE